MGKYCGSCGTALNGAKFCPNCGAPANGAQPNQPVHSQPAPQTKPKKKRGCLTAVIAVIALLTIGAIVGTLSSGGTEAGDKNPIGSNNAASSSAGVSKDKENTVPLGETVTTDEFSMCVNSCSDATEISAASGYMKYTPDSGKYAIVNLTIKNVSKSSQSIFLNEFKFITPDGVSYSPTLILSADENFLTADSINPGLDVTGNIPFNVPADLDVSQCKVVYAGLLSFSSTKFSLS